MKRPLVMAAAAAVVVAAAAPASAQSLFPFFDAGPQTESTATFRAEALRSDAYEIESSRIALERSRSPAVRRYARQVIRDHKQTTDALLPPGTSLNAAGQVVSDSEKGPFDSPFGILTAPLSIPVSVVNGVFTGTGIVDNRPNEPGKRVALDPRRQQQLAELQGVRAGGFNGTYAAQQVAAHQQAVALYRDFAANGNSPEGRTFAGQALPALEHHLRWANGLEERYGESEAAF